MCPISGSPGRDYPLPRGVRTMRCGHSGERALESGLWRWTYRRGSARSASWFRSSLLTKSDPLAEATAPTRKTYVTATVSTTRTLVREIERHGGMLEKYAGDAVMAVFGVPLARGQRR